MNSGGQIKDEHYEPYFDPILKPTKPLSNKFVEQEKTNDMVSRKSVVGGYTEDYDKPDIKNNSKLTENDNVPIFNATTNLKPDRRPFKPRESLPREAKAKGRETVKGWVEELSIPETPLRVKPPNAQPSAHLSASKVHIDNLNDDSSYRTEDDFVNF
jgi:hypothetical protein